MRLSFVPSIFLTGLVSLTMALSSCSSDPANIAADDNVLVQVGDSSLSMDDVLLRIPRGLAAEDSAAMFRTIVDEWVRELVLVDFAKNNIPDIERIERLVESYRNNLIVTSYLQSMSERSQSEVGESRIKQYYESNKSNMVLEEPIVKGAFLKVSQSDQSLDRLRDWMAEFSESSIDKIEEAGLRHASNYKYFKDTWQSWGDIASQIPYRFFDADAFVRSTKNFETADGGSVYLLHISDYLPSGSEMPYEYARIKIKEILSSSDFAKRREQLISDIYKREIKEGILKPGLYDPVAGKMRSQDTN